MKNPLFLPVFDAFFDVVYVMIDTTNRVGTIYLPVRKKKVPLGEPSGQTQITGDTAFYLLSYIILKIGCNSLEYVLY